MRPIHCRAMRMRSPSAFKGRQHSIWSPSTWADACPVDERTLADLMGEIQDPALRLTLLCVCVELAEVDAHVDDGESIVLVAAVEHWGMHREMFRSSSRN